MTLAHDQKRLLLEEAAQVTAWERDGHHARCGLHTEDLPARKIGREWKFSRRALIEWVGTGSSTQFYNQASAELRSTEEAARRTAGWNLELD